MIKLTGATNDKCIYVDPSRIEAIETNTRGNTLVHLLSGARFQAIETPDRILDLIRAHDNSNSGNLPIVCHAWKDNGAVLVYPDHLQSLWENEDGSTRIYQDSPIGFSVRETIDEITTLLR